MKKCRNPERDAWVNMIHHCYNENHKYYPRVGGLGIRVCDAWRDRETGFQQFKADVGERPDENLVLRRIDRAKDFEPGNVHWAARGGEAILVEIGGVTKSLSKWAEVAGLTTGTICNRYRDGVRGPALIDPVNRNRGIKRGKQKHGSYLL